MTGENQTNKSKYKHAQTRVNKKQNKQNKQTKQTNEQNKQNKQTKQTNERTNEHEYDIKGKIMTTGINIQEQSYRTIDTRMKEVYFEAKLVQEDRKTLESRFKFWNTLNIMAINNMSIQQVRMHA